MGLFKKKHIHEGKAVATRQVEWFHGMAGRAHKWTTEVRSICDECKTPFIVEYDGLFEEDEFKDVIVRKKS